MKEEYSFQYQLNYDEAYETFMVLSNKWPRKVRILLTGAVIAIAVVMLILYYLDSRRAHLFVIAIAAILILVYMLYFPPIKAKRGAARVQKTGGTYRIVLTAGGEIVLPNKSRIPLKGDKEARVVETDHVFALRPDRLTTICIPKRVVKKDDLEGIRQLFSTYVKFQDLTGGH